MCIYSFRALRLRQILSTGRDDLTTCGKGGTSISEYTQQNGIR